MIKRRNQKNRKPLIIGLVIAIIAVLLLTVVAGFSVKNASDNYSSKIGAHEEALSNELAEPMQAFELLAQQRDTQRSIALIHELSDKLTSRSQQIPQLPSIFGVSVAPLDVKNQSDSLDDALANVIIDLNTATTIMQYQATVAALLSPLSGVSVVNQEQATSYVQQWKTTLDQINSIEAPALVKTVHEQLQAIVAQIHESASALPQTYADKDNQTFNTLQAELETRIDTLKALSGDLTEIDAQLDSKLSTDISKLKELI